MNYLWISKEFCCRHLFVIVGHAKPTHIITKLKRTLYSFIIIRKKENFHFEKFDGHMSSVHLVWNGPTVALIPSIGKVWTNIWQILLYSHYW